MGAIFVLIILAALECFEVSGVCVEREHPKFRKKHKTSGPTDSQHEAFLCFIAVKVFHAVQIQGY